MVLSARHERNASRILALVVESNDSSGLKRHSEKKRIRHRKPQTQLMETSRDG